MKKTTLAAALVAAATLAGSAQAQVCASFPTVDRGFSLGGRIDFPEGLDQFGVEASLNAAGPLSVFGGLNVISGDDDNGGDDSLDQFFAGIALETPVLAQMLGPRASVCPQARFEYIDTDIGSFTSIPVGLGIGATYATSPAGPTVSPYVIPQVVFLRADYENDAVDNDSETQFGLRGGALVTFGMFFFGGEANYLGGDNSDTTLGIRAGVRF
jgi:hypothetical protein